MLAFNLLSQPAQQGLTPFIDVYEMEDNVILLADMPGVSREEVDISVVDNRLTIRGRCMGLMNQNLTVDGLRLAHECPHCDYYRVLKVSDVIDTEGIQARMQDGVLTLTLPKRKVVQTVEIPISIE